MKYSHGYLSASTTSLPVTILFKPYSLHFHCYTFMNPIQVNTLLHQDFTGLASFQDWEMDEPCEWRSSCMQYLDLDLAKPKSGDPHYRSLNCDKFIWRHQLFCLDLDHFLASIYQVFISKFLSVWQNTKHVWSFQIVSFLSYRGHQTFIRQVQHLHHITFAELYFVAA